jgi:hypothetical protein
MPGFRGIHFSLGRRIADVEVVIWKVVSRYYAK